MTWWSAIPGETPIDPSGLKVKGVTNRRELDLHEAENIRKATVKYLTGRPNRRLAPFDLPWVKKLHREMLGDVWEWAGTVRTINLNLGVDWTQIETSLHDLLESLRLWERNDLDLIEQAAMLHHRAVHIHPFLNGNGRWSRMLANVWLKQHKAPPTVWPDATIGTESPIRDTYLAAIRAADEGDYEPLMSLHRKYTG